MAVADVSATDKDAVGPFLECFQYLMWAHRGRAQGAYRPHIGRILETAHACEIRARIRAPVAEEAHDDWFELFIGHEEFP
jgi:hypothetical protein